MNDTLGPGEDGGGGGQERLVSGHGSRGHQSLSLSSGGPLQTRVPPTSSGGSVGSPVNDWPPVLPGDGRGSGADLPAAGGPEPGGGGVPPVGHVGAGDLPDEPPVALVPRLCLSLRAAAGGGSRVLEPGRGRHRSSLVYGI